MTLTRAAARTLKAVLPHPNSATEHCTANASTRSSFDTTNSWEEAQPQSCSIGAEQLMCSLDAPDAQGRNLRRYRHIRCPGLYRRPSVQPVLPAANTHCQRTRCSSLGAWLTFTAARIKVCGTAPHEQYWIINIREDKV